MDKLHQIEQSPCSKNRLNQQMKKKIHFSRSLDGTIE